MIKQILTILMYTLGVSTGLFAFQSDFITYEKLVEIGVETGYTDHIPHWRRLFNVKHVRGFLECGCGYSTVFFLDNCDKVVSVEYFNPGFGDKWYQTCLSLLSDRPNWIPMTYNLDLRSNSFNNACIYQCSTHMDYAKIDPSYLKELDKHIKAILKKAKEENYEIDVAFVDPGMFLRGDLVKLLLANKVPIVAAHDTNTDYGTNEEKNLYGWNKVSTPPNYEKIYIPYGQGTTFWINARFPELIVAMQDYRDAIIQMKENGKGNISPETITNLADTFN